MNIQNVYVDGNVRANDYERNTKITADLVLIIYLSRLFEALSIIKSVVDGTAADRIYQVFFENGIGYL